ncbi:MAG: hypothetical protein AVDCRST_MAG93-3677 [uncultured Chloroflexia bacterium]|uniref:Uncharacterized protein n=1 Tax=uncultured Chloroflexia bacterium TaxID=1672391 RepID=A0A6J4JUD5_9CHLR|nr:MAG: hypothetical protein AVDCRST_MAG93-3677 [uncultured Chloroflexia bacterium]
MLLPSFSTTLTVTVGRCRGSALVPRWALARTRLCRGSSQGLRLFENFPAEAVELEKLEVTEAPLRTHLKFRVVKRRSMT